MSSTSHLVNFAVSRHSSRRGEGEAGLLMMRLTSYVQRRRHIPQVMLDSITQPLVKKVAGDENRSLCQGTYPIHVVSLVLTWGIG